MKGPLKGKRKSSDSGGGKAKRQKESEKEALYQSDSVFCNLLTKSGLILKTGKHRNDLGVDQAVFLRDLGQQFKRSSDQKKLVEEFMEGLQIYLEEPDRFHLCLFPTETASDCETSIRGGHQECLIRLLLGVEVIQPKLMNLLLEKLPEFMGEDDSIFEQGEAINIPRLIMSQFRWLDRIVDSKELTTKMLEMVTITSLDIQREIITCIPEVVDDDQHADVAKSLRDLLLESNTLTVPILDALSNLTLKPELLAEVRGSVIQTLVSVEMEDLPVVTKFLLQSISGPDAVEVIGQMRDNLDFQSTCDASVSVPTKQNGKKDGSKSAESLTLDAIKSGIRFQKSVAEAWIKIIDGVKEPTNHKVIDIFVLLILHSTSRKKAVESLFRNKIRSGGFTEALLQSAFKLHALVLRDYFPSILSLAEVLLRSPDPSISHLACAIYKLAFPAFDTFCKQEIVGNLVTHIGSGLPGEIDASLDILADLVAKDLKSMAPFAVFVKGVLDYLDNLQVVQIRKLYSLLSDLAFRNPKDGGLIQDDLHIIIRKQLSNSDPKYKRMGVIGAVMVVRSMGDTSNHGDTAEKGHMADDVYKQVCNLLQLVKTSVGQTPEALALFMDELSAVIAGGHLNTKVEEWIADNVTNDFQDDFVVDIEPEALNQEILVAMDKLFGLDSEEDGNIAINLLPLIIQSYDSHKQQGPPDKRIASPVCLAAHFRLVRICEQRQCSDLEGIDALLGCPVYTVKEGVEEKMESLSIKEKDVICNTLFQCINWFREVVNGFASQDDPEMKVKVITRLQNITSIQTLLETCLKVYPSFQPAMAVFDWEESVAKAPAAPSKSGGGKPGRKGGKKKKGGSEESNQTLAPDDTCGDISVLPEKDASQTESQVRDKDQQTPGDKVSVDLANYRPFFRELDMDVFTILNTGFITQAALDTEMNTKSTTDVQIQPPQLAFLLEDLSKKLNHSLLTSASKRRTFLKTKSDKKIGFSQLQQMNPREIAKKGVQLLPALCQHLEAASGFFQTLIDENDGMIDGPGSSSPEAENMATCFNLLLQCLLSLFSWNGFLLTENRGLLQEALGVLVRRIRSSKHSQLGLQALLKTGFEYVEKFSGSLPNLPTAVTFLKLLICLSEKTGAEQMSHTIGAQSEAILKREWLGSDGERLRGAKHNEHLHIIIKTYLTYSDDPLAAAEQITTKAVPELLDADKNGCSQTYPTLDRYAFPVFYKVMLAELVASIKDLQPVKKDDPVQVKLDSLIRWNLAVRIFHVLINLIKAFDSRSNIGSALKYGRQFVDVFLRLGMPMLDHMFRGHRDDVQGLLKNLQLSTRAMHHICGHSKIVQDVSLTNQVPMVKRTLETFVYRVKAMLTMAKCLEAFWVGNLKNRDLQGAEILSQSTVASTQGEDSDAGSDAEREGLPEEQEDSDVEVDNQSEASNETKNAEDRDEDSYSAIF